MTGLVELSAVDYHADPCEQPSLSSSIAKLLVTRSPAHAFVAHPRLNPAFVKVEEEKFDLGTAAHALLLEGRNAVQVIEADDWRTKASKELRDEARAAGRIPLLSRHWADVLEMVGMAKQQLADHQADPSLFQDGKPEQTITWEDNGVHCRARIDWLHDSHDTIDDYKTTSRSADPTSWVRSSLFGMGYDLQAAFYLRGCHAVFGSAPEWRWCVQETQPPYALSVITPGPDVLALADAKVDYAISVWKGCLASGRWPAYRPAVATAELPSYEETRWLERVGIEDAA